MSYYTNTSAWNENESYFYYWSFKEYERLQSRHTQSHLKLPGEVSLVVWGPNCANYLDLKYNCGCGECMRDIKPFCMTNTLC